jgi:hypothetical protein
MRTVLVLALLASLSACASSSHQMVPMPAQDTAVRSDSTRIYVGRRDQVTGSWRNVRVLDNDREIGVLHDGEYLCWDRGAGQGVARLIFEGLGFDESAVESVCELPAEPGGTVYLGVTIDREGHKPMIERIGADEGRAAVAKRKPAAVTKP